MPAVWADDMDDTTPLPRLEPFFVLAALELGDPESYGWLMNSGLRFHDLYHAYRNGSLEPWNFPSSNKVLIQYLIWYEREKPKHSQS